MDEQCVHGEPVCNCCQGINDVYLIQEDLSSGDRWYAVPVCSVHAFYSLECYDSANSYDYIAPKG